MFITRVLQFGHFLALRREALRCVSNKEKKEAGVNLWLGTPVYYSLCEIPSVVLKRAFVQCNSEVSLLTEVS